MEHVMALWVGVWVNGRCFQWSSDLWMLAKGSLGYWNIGLWWIGGGKENLEVKLLIK